MLLRFSGDGFLIDLKRWKSNEVKMRVVKIPNHDSDGSIQDLESCGVGSSPTAFLSQIKHNLSELNALRGFRTGGERQRSAERFAKGAKTQI